MSCYMSHSKGATVSLADDLPASGVATRVSLRTVDSPIISADG